MQIKDPGWFSRGKISLPPSPHVTPDTLLQDLQQAFGPQGCEVYKTALIGADLVLKRSGFTGVAIKIKHGPAATEILFNPFAPSALARIFLMGLIPILILQAGPWKQLVADFKAYAGASRMLGGQLGAPAPYGAMQGAPMAPQLPAAHPGYGQGQPQQPQQPQQAWGQPQQGGYAPPGYGPPPQGGGNGGGGGWQPR